jgi:hypothetical protein
MKIAIAGAGIAGGYLATLLEQKGISPDVFDGRDPGTRCGCRSCGWGAPRRIQTYLTEAGFDLDNYLLESMARVNFDGLVASTPLCTFDKPRLIRDVTQRIRLITQDLGPGRAEGYDVVVDATGIQRAFLPPCRSDLILPTLQHRVKVIPRGGERLEAKIDGQWIPGFGIPLDLSPRRGTLPYRRGGYRSRRA